MSGLDAASEADVRLALASVLPGCTILVVTHRLTALHIDDAVIVLKEGHVVWQGVYAALTKAPAMIDVAVE